MEIVKIKNWTSFTTSEILANDFGIPHCDILTYIREIELQTLVPSLFFRDISVDKCACSCGESIWPQEITRDGFSLLIPYLSIKIEKIICYLGEFNHADLKINKVNNLRKERKKEERNISNDPWKHRSKGLKCKTCMWFVKKENSNNSTVGRCRKNAPIMGGYPVVFEIEWCGAHKLNENAI